MRAIESRADGSLWFRIALAPTLVSFLIGAQRRFKSNERTNKQVCIFASLWSFSVDLTFSRAAPRLVDLHTIPACYWSKYFGCFRQYWSPGQDVSRMNGTYGHPIYNELSFYSKTCCSKFEKVIEVWKNKWLQNFHINLHRYICVLTLREELFTNHHNPVYGVN